MTNATIYDGVETTKWFYTVQRRENPFIRNYYCKGKALKKMGLQVIFHAMDKMGPTRVFTASHRFSMTS